MAESNIGGSRSRALQQRKPRGDAFTAARRRTFFDTLAVTANVSHAAKAAGVSLQTAYRWKQHDAEFRAAWDAALETGYARLEEELLARALGTGAITEYVPGDSAVPAVPFDPMLAVQVLGIRDRKGTRRPNARYAAAVPLEELRRELKHKLDMLAARLGNTR
ncbi:hypothetical protein [Sphingomonas immobilis]|uniref:Terminase n=1 Tax=Sphingomonas immobilis TaxID=3063997 RepID=A0ABT9A1N3_9SPHN|nr:hypothetical protein [Sphingomonas sp. CA1-15]MDO7843733.1 hypothetical protein [Sphingomonas sp. CA1-15]